jgi:amino acid transporter
MPASVTDSPEPQEPQLVRGLSLAQATALNMIDMVGIGPFITISFVIGAMKGPQCMIAWIVGAVLSLMDGFVWAELGAAFPRAGGSYIFLRKLYGEERWGRLFSFLYIWQTTIQAPLVIASGAIGFAHYLAYIYPLGDGASRMVSGGLVLLITALLYRKIADIGKISVFMWAVVAGTMIWLIVAGLTHFHSELAFTFPEHAFDLNGLFFVGLGMASTKTIYSFLGYYNVCHLGGEIREPEKNIPRSIFISITGICILYLLMQVSVLGVIPWQEAQGSEFIVSTFFERIYGSTAAIVATSLILFIAMASLFSATLGYSRIPYAAAVNGDYFRIFSRLHPTRQFPHVSLLILCGVSFVFSLLFKLADLITALIVMRILVQFIAQAAGLIAYRYKNKEAVFPFRMWLFPLPAIISIGIWLFIFFSNEWRFMLLAGAVIASGIMIFLVRASLGRSFPFQDKRSL